MCDLALCVGDMAHSHVPVSYCFLMNFPHDFHISCRNFYSSLHSLCHAVSYHISNSHRYLHVVILFMCACVCMAPSPYYWRLATSLCLASKFTHHLLTSAAVFRTIFPAGGGAGGGGAELNRLTNMMERVSTNVESFLKTQEDNVTVKGSECKRETFDRFRFGPLSSHLVRWILTYSPTSSKIFGRLLSAVSLYTQDMMVYKRHGLKDEVAHIQPRTRMLLKTLVQIVGMSNSVEVRYERGSDAVQYTSREYRIRGEMDIGLFSPNTSICVLPWEVKNLDAELKWKWITQCAGEMAGKLELLNGGYDIIPSSYCGILVSGRRWIVLFRRMVGGARLWQHTLELAAFDDNGVMDKRALYKVVMLLYHSLMTAKKVLEQIESVVRVKPTPSTREDYDGGRDMEGDDDGDNDEKDDDEQVSRDDVVDRGRGGNVGSQGKENVWNRLTIDNVASLDKLLPRQSLLWCAVHRDY